MAANKAAGGEVKWEMLHIWRYCIIEQAWAGTSSPSLEIALVDNGILLFSPKKASVVNMTRITYSNR